MNAGESYVSLRSTGKPCPLLCACLQLREPHAQVGGEALPCPRAPAPSAPTDPEVLLHHFCGGYPVPFSDGSHLAMRFPGGKWAALAQGTANPAAEDLLHQGSLQRAEPPQVKLCTSQLLQQRTRMHITRRVQIKHPFKSFAQ